MKNVNIRDLTHNFALYMNLVKSGERLVIMERNKPIADIYPHNENVKIPAWKRKIDKISLTGEPLSATVIKSRKE